MIRTDLGPVSAYALAVEYAEYTGTVEEFAQLQANSANNAAAAAASAAAAEAAANSVNISDINQSFALEENWVLTYEGSDLIQGGYNADGSVNAQGTNYLRTSQMIPVYNGMSMYFKGGDVINRMKAGYFDPVTRRLDSSKDIPWMTGEQTVIFAFDGLIIPLFRRFDNAETQPSEFDAEFELISATKTKIDDRVLYSHRGDSVSGDIDSNTMLECGYETQTRKNQILSFCGKIPSGTTFNNLEIGLKSGNNYYNKVVIDGTNVAFTVGLGNVITQAHELTITKNIQVTVHTFVDNKATVRITSNGNFVDLKFGSYQQWRGGKAYAKTSQALEDCTLSWANADIAERIWIFGDSYTAYASNRWPYYAGAWLGNVLLDGYGGEASAQAISAFGGYLYCGVPEYAVFATGMNDGSDPNNETPNTNWKTAVEGFLETCRLKTITPILCTIPTTPVFNNNGKNAYVRSSGHRYIDFASAVGADETGSWYAEMLGEDNIHPTVAGAKALCAQIEADLPEVFIDSSGIDKTLTVSNMAADSKAVGEALAGKVSAVSGKGLSTNDYTTAEKTKLAGIDAQATRVLIDDTLEETGQAADAKAVGDALASLEDDIPAVDNTLSVTGAAADAKKTGDEIAGLKEDLSDAPKVLEPEETEADLYICDQQGNVIGEFVGGHIKTKNFDSSNVGTDMIMDADSSDADLYLCDSFGHVIVEFANGHIKTKNFDSENASEEILQEVQEELETLSENVTSLQEATSGILYRSKDQIDGVYATCRWHQPNAQSKQFCLLLAGDSHNDSTRMNNMVEFLNNIDAFDAGIMLGDMSGNEFSDPITNYTNALSSTQKPFLTVLGNHDVVGATSDSDLYTKYGDCFQYANLASGEAVSGKCYYYKDFATYKIRVIVMMQYDLTYSGNLCYGQEQIDWLIDILNDTPSDYGVIIAEHTNPSRHMIYNLDASITSSTWYQSNYAPTNMDGDPVPDIVNAWINGTTLSQSYDYTFENPPSALSVSADFSARGNGEFITYIGGHWHMNVLGSPTGFANQFDYHVPAAGLSAALQGDMPRRGGTVSEDSLNVLSIDRDKKMVKVFQIGAHYTKDAVNRQYFKYNYGA